MERNTISIVDGSVEYIGRARSTLERGNYLIIFKDDGSVSIHGANKIKPLNYLSNCTFTAKDETTLAWSNKKESISVKVHEIIHTFKSELSKKIPVVTKTEKQLADKIISNWTQLIGRQCAIVREQQTIHGPIDIYAVDQAGHIIIEVKRKNAMLKDVTQVLRYKETFEGDIECYVAAPGISKKAAAYAEKHRVKFLQVHFD